VVVTHGTATLEETAYLMDLTLGSDKPVVFTARSATPTSPIRDGPRNLLYAAMIAGSPAARGRACSSARRPDHWRRDATKINPEIVTCSVRATAARSARVVVGA